MGGAKPWQFVVLALGFAAIVFTIVYTFVGGDKAPDLATKVTVVDVNSGQLFEVDVSKMGLMVPMTNPDTNTPTLYPVYREEGQVDWKIMSQYVSVVRALPDGQTAAMADKRQGVLKPISEQPKPLSQS